MSVDVLPLAIAGAAVYVLSRPRIFRPRKPVQPVMDPIGTTQPLAPLSQVLFSNAVRGKNLVLQSTSRGAEGSVKYTYLMPDCNQYVHSYAPLEMHQAL